jgi:hypothetical protein
MPAPTASPDLAAIQRHQQTTWPSGDDAPIGTQHLRERGQRSRVQAHPCAS